MRPSKCSFHLSSSAEKTNSPSGKERKVEEQDERSRHLDRHHKEKNIAPSPRSTNSTLTIITHHTQALPSSNLTKATSTHQHQRSYLPLFLAFRKRSCLCSTSGDAFSTAIQRSTSTSQSLPRPKHDHCHPQRSSPPLKHSYKLHKPVQLDQPLISPLPWPSQHPSPS